MKYGWYSLDVVRFYLTPFFKVIQETVLKVAYLLLIIGSRALGCETNLLEIIGWYSFEVVMFDHGPLLHDQMTVANICVSILA